MKRLQINAGGGVQGVGFRPFVYRLARSLSITGWIRNSPSGVTIEVQGTENSLALFCEKLESQLPQAAFISSIHFTEIPLVEEITFDIRRSGSGKASAVMMPDMATCNDCLIEVFDPDNRRYLYPFTNCTNCGPRFSIIRSLPYDRSGTSMSGFPMCQDCAEEYADPLNRRFHAQPNACPVCGPRVILFDSSGALLAEGNEAVSQACSQVLQGKIVAVKGLGGFHLLTRADDDGAVRELRIRKSRPFKPLAVMIPDTGRLNADRDVISLLLSPAAPVTLVEKDTAAKLQLSPLISPGSSTYGLMVPYTPLHHIMLRNIGVPVVATSGNRASEPICICLEEGLVKLRGIADFFLDHNRPIVRPVDDSVVAVSREGITPFRRSRGYAPLPLSLPGIQSGIVALGGNERNTVAVSIGDAVVLSQHLGEMSDTGCLEAAGQALDDLKSIYGITSSLEIVDLHPDYAVRQLVSGEIREIQHHHAHVLSCMTEHRLHGPALGIVWDGSGYGPDGSVWGGEFITVDTEGVWERTAHFRRFPLPGGEKAVKCPPRTAAGMFFEAGIQDLTSIPGIDLALAEALSAMMTRSVNSPVTSSAGRLFDGVSAVLGLCTENSYSGQAAIELQSIAVDTVTGYPVSFSDGTVDWVPVLIEILNEIRSGTDPGIVSGRFHRWLSSAALRVAEVCCIKTVVLSGGCFQNTLLLDLTAHELRRAGFDVYSHHTVPPGDGGLSLGQAAAGMEVKNVSRYSRQSY